MDIVSFLGKLHFTNIKFGPFSLFRLIIWKLHFDPFNFRVGSSFVNFYASLDKMVYSAIA